MAQLMSGDPKNQNIPGLDAILRGEVLRKDALIAQLMNQGNDQSGLIHTLFLKLEFDRIFTQRINHFLAVHDIRTNFLPREPNGNMLELQNKMVMGAKERQDVEMAAQQETLEEQRSHIQILDSALSQAQAQVLRLEEESRQVL